MIKHIVAWNFKEGFTAEENLNNAKKVKEGLEGLKNKISVVKEIEVIINPLKSGDFDVVLISVFDSVEALATYQGHEEHLKVGEFVRSALCNRKCIDYEI